MIKIKMPAVALAGHASWLSRSTLLVVGGPIPISFDVEQVICRSLAVGQGYEYV